ncbi:hypothetical protein FOL47_003535 [Perkinsus chesapeaki]|uniref:Uncharacterized protein n=1 Tax=Perkinsus chesapeaki TaxID=330153 RepID=A0A7J6N0C6_PERCH|nr:hypothetical protein FOL47_003535 [Perkinsus chesapeaki]
MLTNKVLLICLVALEGLFGMHLSRSRKRLNGWSDDNNDHTNKRAKRDDTKEVNNAFTSRREVNVNNVDMISDDSNDAWSDDSDSSTSGAAGATVGGGGDGNILVMFAFLCSNSDEFKWVYYITPRGFVATTSLTCRDKDLYYFAFNRIDYSTEAVMRGSTIATTGSLESTRDPLVDLRISEPPPKNGMECQKVADGVKQHLMSRDGSVDITYLEFAR